MSKPLGKTQQAFLDCVKQSGSFYVGCGWIWQNASVSLRLAQSLVNRGLLVKERREHWSKKYTHEVFVPAKGAAA